MVAEIKGARPLGIFGESVTTDHISPAGSIKKTSPAGQYLVERGVNFVDFNSYGSRRGYDLGHDPRHLRQCAHQEPHGSRYPDDGVKYFSGTATYAKDSTLRQRGSNLGAKVVLRILVWLRKLPNSR